MTLRQDRQKRIWSVVLGCSFRGFGLLAENGIVWGRTAAYIQSKTLILFAKPITYERRFWGPRTLPFTNDH
jgi:hypothetical protein